MPFFLQQLRMLFCFAYNSYQHELHHVIQPNLTTMKIIFRIVAVLLFILFFSFALKNTDEVVLHLFLNNQAKSPLILLLLIFFIAGAVLGVLAMTGILLRTRRELVSKKKMLEKLQSDADTAAKAKITPPKPDTLIEQIGM